MNRSIHLPFPALLCALLIAFLVIPGCLESSSQVPDGGGAAQGSPACPGGDILFLTEDLYPFNYADSNGTLQGQSVEVARELHRRLNCSTRIELHPWGVAYQMAQDSPGTAIFSTARNEEREEKFEWVGPIGSWEFILYTRNDSGIRLESLEAARNAGQIAVVAGDARHTFLVDRNFTNIRTYSTDEECLGALLNHTVSLWVGSSATTPGMLQRYGVPEGDVVPSYSLLRSDLYIAFHRDTPPATIRSYQHALDAMKADGTFARITGTGTQVSSSPVFSGERITLASHTLLPAFSALISARMHGIAAAMETLALTGELESGDWERIRPLLVRIEREYPEARFWYARPDGSYYTTVDNLTRANLRDRSYFPGVLAGTTSIGTVVVSKTTGRYTAIVAVPVRNEKGVSGVLGASVYCDTIEEMLVRDFPLPENFYVFALDSGGMPVFDSLPGRIFSLERLPETKNQVLASRDGDVEFLYEGALHRAVFTTDDLTGWKLAIGWKE